MYSDCGGDGAPIPTLVRFNFSFKLGLVHSLIIFSVMSVFTPDHVIDQILSLIDSFNYERVEKTMVALDWKWSTTTGLVRPSVEAMKDKCFGLLIEAERRQDTVATGGFVASYKKKDGRVTLKLTFNVAEGWVDY